MEEQMRQVKTPNWALYEQDIAKLCKLQLIIAWGTLFLLLIYVFIPFDTAISISGSWYYRNVSIFQEAWIMLSRDTMTVSSLWAVTVLLLITIPALLICNIIKTVKFNERMAKTFEKFKGKNIVETKLDKVINYFDRASGFFLIGHLFFSLLQKIIFGVVSKNEGLLWVYKPSLSLEEIEPFSGMPNLWIIPVVICLAGIITLWIINRKKKKNIETRIYLEKYSKK